MTAILFLLCSIAGKSAAQCVPPAIITQPQSHTITCGHEDSFTVTATGTSLTYQWQQRWSTSEPWIDIVDGDGYGYGANTPTLTFSQTTGTSGPTTWYYRVLINGTCGNEASDQATLTVNQIVAEVSPTSVNVCAPVTGLIPLSITTINPYPVVVMSDITYSSGALNTPIPDLGDNVGITNSIIVPALLPEDVIVGANVYVNINHTWIGDIVAAIKAPNNNVLNLDYKLGSTGGSGPTTGFNGTAICGQGTTQALATGLDPWNGFFIPDAIVATGGSNPSAPTSLVAGGANVNSFNDLYSVPSGTWTLGVYDYNMPNQGSLQDWKLDLIFAHPAPATFQGTWLPVTGLYRDAAGTIPYVAGTPASTVYLNPTYTTTYTVTPVTAQCYGVPVSIPVIVNNASFFYTQPVSTSACIGGDASFFAYVYTGGTGTFQWQVNPGTGWEDIPGATNISLNLASVTAALNGNQYHLVASNGTCSAIISDPATLTVTTSPTILQQPVSVSACDGGWAYFNTNPNGISYTYQWQVNTVAGWVDIPGATHDTLYIYPVTTAMNGNQYHVIISGTGCAGITVSDDATLTVSALPVITTQPEDVNVCEGDIAIFNTVVTGSGLSYQWQVSVDGGLTFTDIPASNSPTLNTQPVTLSMNHFLYRVNIFSGCPNIISSDIAELLVNPTPVIITQPLNASTCLGGNGTFTIDVTGANIFYQWEYSTAGCAGPYASIPGATSPTLVTGTVTVTSYYRCRITNGCATGFIYSDCATLTVSSGINIITQPADQNLCSGNDAIFSVVTNTSGANFQWQVSIAGGSFTDIAGATDSTLIIPSVTVANSGNQYQVVISSTNCPGNITTNPATLTVNDHIDITSSQIFTSVCEGDVATFNVTATGSNLSYQWQLSTDHGTTYTLIPGAINPSYTTGPVAQTMSYYLYQVVITGGCGLPVVADADTLHVRLPISFYSQPVDATVCAGNGNTFSAGPYGYNISMQWQVSSTGCSGSFVDIPGETNIALALTNITASQDNYAYRCFVTDGCGFTATSGCAILHVNSTIGITTQPVNVNACIGSYSVFYVTTGVTGINYQWQVSVTGSAFTDMPGETNSILTLPSVTTDLNGNQYRVILSSTDCPNPTISDAATLTVYGLIDITSQPESQQACVGDAVTFSAAVTGANLTYTWMVSTDGGAQFNYIPGANGSSYTTAPVTIGMNLYLYKLFIQSPCTYISSSLATLYVNTTAVVYISADPSNTSLLPGQSATLTAEVVSTGAYTYAWQKDNVDIPGATAITHIVNAGEPGAYRVVATNVTGCTGASNIINVTDSILGGGKFTLFSNPSDGRFTISYPNLPVNSSVAIFDNHGSRSMIKSNLGSNQLIHVDMRYAASGVYTVIVYNTSGERLATGKVIIIH